MVDKFNQIERNALNKSIALINAKPIGTTDLRLWFAGVSVATEIIAEEVLLPRGLGEKTLIKVAQGLRLKNDEEKLLLESGAKKSKGRFTF